MQLLIEVSLFHPGFQLTINKFSMYYTKCIIKALDLQFSDLHWAANSCFGYWILLGRYPVRTLWNLETEKAKYLLNSFMLNFFHASFSSLIKTRLDEPIGTDVANIPGYDVVVKDRNQEGGSVAIYHRSILITVIRDDLIPEGIEAVCIDFDCICIYM